VQRETDESPRSIGIAMALRALRRKADSDEALPVAGRVAAEDWVTKLPVHTPIQIVRFSSPQWLLSGKFIGQVRVEARRPRPPGNHVRRCEWRGALRRPACGVVRCAFRAPQGSSATIPESFRTSTDFAPASDRHNP
jgi:hypothetical protein